MSDVRSVEVAARSTDVFGRVLASARNHHLVVDGPIANGCPGEELTPPELFLSAVATCGVELVQVLARDRGTTIGPLEVRVEGTLDPSNRVREDVNVFNRVRVDFTLRGVGDADAAALVEAFKGR
jgi:uncharacterized OsmC-like protein